MIRTLAKLAAAAASAGGLIYWWNRRLDQRQQVASPERVEVPSSATSLSAQPHKRTRLVPPPAPRLDDAPPPDSAETGRTPHYFVPGEALLTIESAAPLDDAFLREQVAPRFGAEYAPVESRVIGYPTPEKEAGWTTVVRLRWPADDNYEKSLNRFTEIESRVNELITWDDARVTTWMPNWLGAVAAHPPQNFVPGGPGAYPRPRPAPRTELSLTDAPFLNQWREAAAHPVTLSILDTFPDRAALAEKTLPPALDGLVERLRAEESELSLEEGSFYTSFRDGVHYEMSDHGLVTAWLASQVIGPAALPRVTLEPVRVATAHGVCSAADIIAGLAPLVERARQGEAIVVLLAFTIGMRDIIPPRLRLYEEHYEALRLACLALNEAGATLLGAAGNDASGLQHPPRTRRPAAFRSVIEVTAGQLAQSDLALYANQAKALALFGGEANLQNQITPNLPSLYGPAVSARVRSEPGREETNTEGWVAWAGTSLAAALAAGLAVLVRSGDLSLKMWDVRTKLRQVATTNRNPGNVPFIDLVRAE